MNKAALNQDIDPKEVNKVKIPDKEKILALTYNEKIRYIDQLRISYPKMNQILQKIEECHHSTETFERPLCMRINGPSGSGKTTLVNIHQKKYPDINTDAGIEKPTLYSRIPCPAYIGGLATKLLNDLGDPFYNRPGKITLHTQRLYKLLKACKVKIIFLDEVQHLVDRNSQKLLRDSSDWFKELIDETGIPVVFLGMSDSNKIFIENEQLANRVRLVENTAPFEFDDTFKKFLYLFDLSLPLEELSGLADSDISKRIHISTGGLIKNISDLLIESTSIALQNSARKISIPILAKAWNKILYNFLESNPFLPESENYL